MSWGEEGIKVVGRGPTPRWRRGLQTSTICHSELSDIPYGGDSSSLTLLGMTVWPVAEHHGFFVLLCRNMERGCDIINM